MERECRGRIEEVGGRREGEDGFGFSKLGQAGPWPQPGQTRLEIRGLVQILTLKSQVQFQNIGEFFFEGDGFGFSRPGKAGAAPHQARTKWESFGLGHDIRGIRGAACACANSFS